MKKSLFLISLKKLILFALIPFIILFTISIYTESGNYYLLPNEREKLPFPQQISMTLSMSAITQLFAFIIWIPTSFVSIKSYKKVNKINKKIALSYIMIILINAIPMLIFSTLVPYFFGV